MTFKNAIASIVFALGSGMALGALADAVLPPSESELVERVRWTFLKRGEGDYFPEIKNALVSGQFAVAEKLASDVITGPAIVSSPQRQAYLLSLAHLHRAEAARGLNAADAAVNADVQSAALLGNLAAIRTLILAWMESARDKGPSVAQAPQGVAIEDVLRAGLDLEEVVSLKAAANGYGQYSDLERAAFALQYKLHNRDSDFVGGVRRFMKMPGAHDYMRTHFLVGTEIPASEDMPGRDALATFFSESDLRRTLASGLGFALPAERPERDLALREIMEMNSWIGDMSGLATVVHFTSVEPGISAPHLVLDPQRLHDIIMAGNTINVRCGGIAHTALVLRVDAARDEIVLTDPLYEFWTPENNSCITSFSLAHYKYGYHVTVLKLSEVLTILDSVQSFRSFSPPAFTFVAAPNGLPGASKAGGAAQCKSPDAANRTILGQSRDAASKRDLFTWFNFEEISISSLEGAKVTHFMVRALEFRGDVVLSLWTRNNCVESAALFLRRSFMQGGQRTFASDLMMSFLRGMFGEADLKAFRALMTQQAGPNSSGAQVLSQALSGEDEPASFQVAGRNTRFSNAVAETGSRWLRIDAK
ncbi:hypothetical protein os1_02040 [Comamonadaceae bacterium OS-1]|nr:hypothetical protein os1_02040 [Comamonadaceae bacterium OS-1]